MERFRREGGKFSLKILFFLPLQLIHPLPARIGDVQHDGPPILLGPSQDNPTLVFQAIRHIGDMGRRDSQMMGQIGNP